MTERDFKILKKIAKNQSELNSYIKEFKISSTSAIGKVHPTVRRGIVGFIADLFELTKPLSDHVKTQLPLDHNIIKQFRNTSTHQYGIITDAMILACLKHCIEKKMIDTVSELIDKYISSLK